MRKHCGNCANYRKETNRFSEECGKCVSERLENGETTDPSHWRALPQTNADRIRAMSDEELAEFLTHINQTNCQDCAFSVGWRCQPDRDDYSDFKKCEEGRKRWLQQPAEVE